MTEEQELQLKMLKYGILNKLDEKYRRGQREHGGNLWDRPVLNDLMDEVVDIYTYTATAVSQRNTIHARATEALMLCASCDLEGIKQNLKEILHITRPE